MKKYLLILIAGMTIMACNNDEENFVVEVPAVEDQIAEDETSEYAPEGIVGSWFLSEVNRGFGGIQTLTSGEVSYRFHDDGLLEVKDASGREQAWFQPTGTYEYCLDEEAGTITIDGSTYWYILEGNKLTIDTGSAWDAPIYVFKRGSVSVES